ncbi:helix-turn-helix domain-containing protein [Sphingomonas sp. RHCKR7]|uniref:helix-turn-helix transcriptional regulator n=1 Tax=Sphingomonas folli TaxID=2862497 RepID=UPI001C6635A0|nr:helix-turn-helix domain-containing protein [Sphingomonas folli]MBW6528727.1 helix-turn-helix domain-containing protein [Sphingomonas folli]
MQKLLSTTEAAPLIGVKPKTLMNWRVLGLGPRHIRAGGRISYDLSDIEAWKSARRVTSTSQPIAA